VPTLIVLPAGTDWLWGPRTGASPWYPDLELLRENETDRLAARLAGC
jgi:hypothetical protein